MGFFTSLNGKVPPPPMDVRSSAASVHPSTMDVRTSPMAELSDVSLAERSYERVGFLSLVRKNKVGIVWRKCRRIVVPLRPKSYRYDRFQGNGPQAGVVAGHRRTRLRTSNACAGAGCPLAAGQRTARPGGPGSDGYWQDGSLRTAFVATTDDGVFRIF